MYLTFFFIYSTFLFIIHLHLIIYFLLFLYFSFPPLPPFFFLFLSIVLSFFLSFFPSLPSYSFFFSYCHLSFVHLFVHPILLIFHPSILFSSCSFPFFFIPFICICIGFCIIFLNWLESIKTITTKLYSCSFTVNITVGFQEHFQSRLKVYSRTKKVLKTSHFLLQWECGKTLRCVTVWLCVCVCVCACVCHLSPLSALQLFQSNRR